VPQPAVRRKRSSMDLRPSAVNALQAVKGNNPATLMIVGALIGAVLLGAAALLLLR
jgi:hypothetical protein